MSGGLGPQLPLGTLAASINAENWTANVTVGSFKTGGTLTLNPTTTPTLTFNVASAGFDTSGNPTTFNRTVVGTIAKRQTWPNETLRVESARGGGATLTIALSDVILASDTVTMTTLSGMLVDNGPGGGGSSSLAVTNQAVTNLSTYTGAPPICAWVTPQCQRATGTFTVELAVASRFGTQGKMVNAVKFIATGQTSGHSNTVVTSSMTASTFATKTGNKVPVYAAAIPLTGFTQNEIVVVDAIIYPFFGPTLQISTAGSAFPSANLCPLRFVCDAAGTYSGATAHVATTGNDSTGTVNNASLPFATIGAALTAIQAFHNANKGRNNIDGGTVALANGTYGSFGPTSPASLTWGQTCWCQITLDTGATKGSVIYNASDTSNQTLPINGGLFFQNVTLHSQGSATFAFRGDNTSPGPDMMWFDNVDLIGDNTTVASFYTCGLIAFSNCLIQQMKTTLLCFSDTLQAATPVVACDIDTCGDQQHSVYAAFGNKYHGLYVTNNQVCVPVAPVAAGTVNAPIQNQSFMMSNQVFGMVGATQTIQAWQVGGQTSVGFEATMGVAFVQNVIERIDNPEVSPAVWMQGDDDGMQCLNAVLAYNTITGARINEMYLDYNAVNVLKRGVRRFNALANRNIKRDTFVSPTGGANGARVNNWDFSFSVGSFGSANQFGGVNGNAPGPDTWLGEYTATDLNNTGGFTGAGSFTNGNPYLYTTNAGSAAYGGTGVGGGNYLPSANTSVLKGLALSGKGMLPIDITGAARRNDGTGYAGAYEGPL